MFSVNHIAKKPVPLIKLNKSLFYWVNLQFNIIDEERRKNLGPDRTCAEWILRNGGAVKWTNSSDILSDYNKLPKEGTKLFLQEVDATGSSIMHQGFRHFQGCDHMSKLVLHKCSYLDDTAIEELHYLKDRLLFLQISSCSNISDKGLLPLKNLKRLRQLLLFDLIGIKDLQSTVQALKNSLNQCNIQIK